MSRIKPKFTFASKRGSAVKFDLETQIKRFLQAKKIEKRSLRTIGTYSQSLEQFRKWYESKPDAELTTETMREFIQYLTYDKTRWDDHPTSPDGGVGLSPRSVNNMLRNMKVFFNYLM